MTSNPQAAQSYLRTRVLTATPEQLQMMLYDGALRFGEQAHTALEQKNYEQTHHNITRVQNIVTQLMSALKPSVLPDLCEKLMALYQYAYKKLVEAGLEHKIESLDEAMKVLKYQRETWAMLMDQLGKAKAGEAARKITFPTPESRMEESISMSA